MRFWATSGVGRNCWRLTLTLGIKPASRQARATSSETTEASSGASRFMAKASEASSGKVSRSRWAKGEVRGSRQQISWVSRGRNRRPRGRSTSMTQPRSRDPVWSIRKTSGPDRSARLYSRCRGGAQALSASISLSR